MKPEPQNLPVAASDATAETVVSDLDLLRKELAEQKDLNLRLAADFENFKRRSRQESEARAAAQKESFIHELLPALDNLERALACWRICRRSAVSPGGGNDVAAIAAVAPPAWHRD